MTINDKVMNHLNKIYDEKSLDEAKELFSQLLLEYTKDEFKETTVVTQKNVYLITYGDSFIDQKQAPLHVLQEVINEKLTDTITDIHLLPMFPYTSDDGFSVTDYLKINPQLGDWQDIYALAKDKRLMFDFVANHMSKSSEWFQAFLNQQNGFENSFITYEPNFDTSLVIRPRTSPLFHSYQNAQQEIVKVWTTFSEDQVDVNVKDPKMLCRLTGVLLEYVKRGATSIRLDAIGFLWKESHTKAMHLPQTHEIVSLWRTLLDEYAPNTQIITETNVPHADNISYFGDGSNEANQVYQFPLPPLVFFSFLKQNAEKLSNWANEINRISDTATYFNFLASHDGIGLRPTEGILTEEERQLLVQRVIENGGRVSYKNNADGSQSVYELNINYSEALKENGKENDTIKKMIAAHHILLSVIGVPAIYYHSIFGSKNDEAAVVESGINRRINRQKLIKEDLLKELTEPGYRKEIYEGLKQLIAIRQQEEAFNPYGEQKVLQVDPRIFALLRKKGKNKILSLTNVSEETVALSGINGFELISQKPITGQLFLAPYQVAWIKEEVN